MTMNLLQDIGNYLVGRFKNRSGSLESQRVALIYAFTLISVMPISIFGFENLFTGSMIVGYIDLVATVILITNLVMFHLRKDITTGSTILVICIIAVILSLLITGGTSGTGMLWSFLIPISGFFLLGTRMGGLWIGIYMTMIILLGIMDYLGLIELYYSGIALRQLVFGLLAEVVLMLVYESVSESMRTNLESKSEELVIINRELGDEIVRRKKTDSDLLIKNKELEKMNQLMVGRELKMVELKAEICNLKKAQQT